MQSDATAMRAWAKAEGTWLDANPAQFCFATVYVLWDIVRMDADQAAADALAGRYEQSAADLNKMSDDSARVVDAMASVTC